MLFLLGFSSPVGVVSAVRAAVPALLLLFLLPHIGVGVRAAARLLHHWAPPQAVPTVKLAA